MTLASATASGAGPGGVVGWVAGAWVAGGWVAGSCVKGGRVDVGLGASTGRSRLPSLPRGRVNASPVPGSTSVKFWMMVVLLWMIVIEVPEKPAKRGPK